MSYRELRNLAEHLRALGYQRIVSVENFRTPNFELVASVLYWMVKRYDPDISVSDSIETEDDRIGFLTTVANALATKAKIKLNTKRLYAADGRAVKELLKVASMLYSASVVNAESKLDDAPEVVSLQSRIKDIKSARTLTSEITELGARLYDLLGREKEVKDERFHALNFLDAVSSNLESTAEHRYIQKSINDLIAAVSEDIEAMKKQCDDLEADERALDAKIKKKQSELERHEKRLKSLQTVRPAFMDEYEKLERELQKQYATYLERYRNLDYLQFELESYHKSEKEKMDENDRTLKRMQRKLREEEFKIMQGEQELNNHNIEKGLTSADKDAPARKRSDSSSAHAGAEATTNSRRRARDASRVEGTMAPVDADDESEDIDSDEISHGSESDSVSIAPSSNAGSDIDDIDDDDDGSEMSDGEEEESNYASGHSSTGEF